MEAGSARLFKELRRTCPRYLRGILSPYITIITSKCSADCKGLSRKRGRASHAMAPKASLRFPTSNKNSGDGKPRCVGTCPFRLLRGNQPFTQQDEQYPGRIYQMMRDRGLTEGQYGDARPSLPLTNKIGAWWSSKHPVVARLDSLSPDVNYKPRFGTRSAL